MSDVFTLFFYNDFRLCLRKAGSSRTDSESIEFHITGLIILFHNRRRNRHHHHHHHHHHFPGLLSVVSSVCLRNLFVHSWTCTGLPLFYVVKRSSKLPLGYASLPFIQHPTLLLLKLETLKVILLKCNLFLLILPLFLSIIRTPATELIIHFLVDPPQLFSLRDKVFVELQKLNIFLLYFVLHFIY